MVKGDNPLTGMFYVGGGQPGDTMAVKNSGSPDMWEPLIASSTKRFCRPRAVESEESYEGM
jgi:hypothetical protein